MTMAYSTTSDAGILGTDQRLGASRTALGKAWMRLRTYWTTLSALRALTDRQLDDIGYQRDHLKAIAHAATL